MNISENIIDDILKDLAMESVENLKIERLVNIVNYKVKQFWNHGILMVKVIWINHDLEKATREIGEKDENENIRTCLRIQVNEFWGQNSYKGGEL